MKRRITTFLLLLVAGTATAQEALWGGSGIVSPEVHEDGSVTFRYASATTEKVSITGDFLPAERRQTPHGEVTGPGMAAFKPDSVEGLWSYTTGPLPSELYNYSLYVNGIKTADPSNVYLVRDIATLTNIFIVGGGRGNLYSVQDVPHGTVSKRWYHSPTLGCDRRVTIYTPAGYEQSEERYPVLYLLHGMGGDEEAWCELGRATQILDNLIAQGKAEPMIVVMANGNADQQGAPGQTHEGLYKPHTRLRRTMEGSFERSFPDIIDFIDKNYRTVAKKEGRAIAGLSMGGFHAMHISRYYPDTFDYVGLFSAAIRPDEKRTAGVEIYADIERTLERQRDNGLALYWIACGTDDFLWDANTQYRALLDSMDFPYTFRQSEGGHTWRNWRVYLSEFVPMLFKK